MVVISNESVLALRYGQSVGSQSVETTVPPHVVESRADKLIRKSTQECCNLYELQLVSAATPLWRQAQACEMCWAISR